MTEDGQIDATLPPDEQWEIWFRQVDVSWLIAAIRLRMSGIVAARVTPEDIAQDTLLHAWRDRHRFAWLGLRAFRRWLLQLADHRLHDAFDHLTAAKRGGLQGTPLLSELVEAAHTSSAPHVVAWVSSTPSRVASARERATLMENAALSLPDDLRDPNHV